MTKDRRQKPISVSTDKWASLNQQKSTYEEQSGDKSDWGSFLETMTLLGLAAAGIYALAKSLDKTSNSVNVQCHYCDKTFAMALPREATRAVHVRCLHCGGNLVVDLQSRT
ncbi:MAG: hypothetical protein HOC20_11700 [Chloroflexi bacterium]|jgi:hypothetical protein|nr:hypothetical protein [Chloroflexota bacterium]